MAQKPARPCAKPQCPGLVRGKERYCPDCRKRELGRENREYDRNYRVKKGTDPFYGTAQWKKLRKIYKNENPLCEMCQCYEEITPAELTDHIIPRRRGGHWTHEDNLMSLCKGCHQMKGGWDRRKDGWPPLYNKDGVRVPWPFKGKLADGLTEPIEEEKPKKRTYRAPYSRS